MAGRDPSFKFPGAEAVEGAEPQASFLGKRARTKKRAERERAPLKSRNWVLAKKESQRKQGKDVRTDTKYTARRRPESLVR